MCNLFELDKNIWSHATMCKLFIFDKNTWNPTTVFKQIIINILKSAIIKNNAMTHEKQLWMQSNIYKFIKYQH